MHHGCMSEEESVSYYKTNRKKRLAYQKQYYLKNAELIKRKRELDTVLNPEKSVARKAYNRAYFLNNRAGIMEKRALRKQERDELRQMKRPKRKKEE